MFPTLRRGLVSRNDERDQFRQAWKTFVWIPVVILMTLAWLLCGIAMFIQDGKWTSFIWFPFEEIQEGEES